MKIHPDQLPIPGRLTSVSNKEDNRPPALGVHGTERVRTLWAYIMPLSVMCAGFLLTHFSQTYVQRQQQMQEIAGFERVADHLTTSFNTIVRQHEDLLVGIRGLFYASGVVTRQEFDQFMSSVDLPSRFPATFGIGWNPRILDADVESYEAQVANDRSLNPAGYPGFRIKPPSQNAERFPLTFLAPDKGLEGPMGIDLSADGNRRIALEAARDSGLLAATPVIELVDLKNRVEDSAGFVIALALYDSVIPYTVEQRRSQFQGVISGAFRIPTLLKEAGVDDRISVALYDVSKGGSSAGQLPFYTRGTVEDSYSSISRTVDIADRVWEIRYYKSAEALHVWTDSSARTIVVFFGVLLSVISGLLLHVLTTSRNRALSLAYSLTEDLTKVNTDLTRSNHDLSQFAYVASHDLQTPVRNVQTTITLLEATLEGVDVPSAAIYMQYLQKSAERMQRLVGDLLDYARTERLEPEYIELDLGDVVSQTLDRLKGVIDDADATVNVDEMPVILGEAVQLERVFSNIVTNALKYVHPDRRPVVDIRIKSYDDFWAISIKDNGLGIEEQHHQRIFQPFQRLHRHDEIEGTGLGLSICKEIVERHGGSLHLSSAIGEGSVFTLFFPMPAQLSKAA